MEIFETRFSLWLCGSDVFRAGLFFHGETDVLGDRSVRLDQSDPNHCKPTDSLYW